MNTLVLDSGALIALDRNDRNVWAMLRVAADEHSGVLAPAGAIAQAWRDGARQVLLVRALQHCDEVGLDGTVARGAGVLCARSRTADVIDASIAFAAAGAARTDPTAIITSDPKDMRRLVRVLNADVAIVAI